MRGLLPLLALVVLMLPLGVSAASSCSNCPPTSVQVNGDGSVTISTEATTKSNCVGDTSPTKGTCNIKVWSTSAMAVYYTDGSPTRLADPFWACPCSAQFWVHSGQGHPYSAMSARFAP